jgi:hypothetical protein
MGWLVSLLPLVIPIIVSQLKGGAAATYAKLESGQPVAIAGATVPDIGHVQLALILSAPTVTSTVK